MAYSLDGGMDHLWNIAPQAPRLNTHSPGQTLVWLNEETDSVNFLRQNRNGRIDWNLVVHYDTNDRPTNFCLQHTRIDKNCVSTTSAVMCFCNHPDEECHFQGEYNLNFEYYIEYINRKCLFWLSLCVIKVSNVMKTHEK